MSPRTLEPLQKPAPPRPARRSVTLTGMLLAAALVVTGCASYYGIPVGFAPLSEYQVPFYKRPGEVLVRHVPRSCEVESQGLAVPATCGAMPGVYEHFLVSVPYPTRQAPDGVLQVVLAPVLDKKGWPELDTLVAVYLQVPASTIPWNSGAPDLPAVSLDLTVPSEMRTGAGDGKPEGPCRGLAFSASALPVGQVAGLCRQLGRAVPRVPFQKRQRMGISIRGVVGGSPFHAVATVNYASR